MGGTCVHVSGNAMPRGQPEKSASARPETWYDLQPMQSHPLVWDILEGDWRMGRRGACGFYLGQSSRHLPP
jgi:hypothetical protein